MELKQFFVDVRTVAGDDLMDNRAFKSWYYGHREPKLVTLCTFINNVKKEKPEVSKKLDELVKKLMGVD